jgi:tRNA-2-methylthio-N6-dimethylallyladenosine synthase
MAQTTQRVFEPLADLRLNTAPIYHDEAQQGSAYSEVSSDIERNPAGRLAYIETYGCQMNFSDTEIIAGVLREMGYGFTRDEATADLILLNTCAIREGAEEKIWHRLNHIRGMKRRRPHLMVGLMGCMAERLKSKLLEQQKMVDLVVGPDAYRSLPTLLAEVQDGQRAINVLLSREETYADIAPVRLNTNGVQAFISITRGCNNMCSFCVVPFTRGRERSRDWTTIVHEAQDLYAEGYREVTLLGQNVDSYLDTSGSEPVNFATLLTRVADVAPDLRIRFSTSHPKDMTDEVLLAMAAYPNICNYIHLPVQSGSSRILDLMNRGYTREWYLQRIARIRELIPDCAISTDIIAGFCSETKEEHQETLSLMREARFDFSFMFFYSERPGTLAARKLPDDIPYKVKKRRLQEVVDLQSELAKASNYADVGKTFEVLIEQESKRSDAYWAGRNDQYKVVVFPKDDTPLAPGSYVTVRITDCTGGTLIGERV